MSTNNEQERQAMIQKACELIEGSEEFLLLTLKKEGETDTHEKVNIGIGLHGSTRHVAHMIHRFLAEHQDIAQAMAMEAFAGVFGQKEEQPQHPKWQSMLNFDFNQEDKN